MKRVAIGLHLRAEDVEGIADATAAAGLVVSSIAVDDDQPLGDRDLLLRVATVRAELLERATFVAVRYGFAFRSAADAEEKIAANARRWRETLEANRTRIELTLKVPSATHATKPDRHDFASGADYMRALQAAKGAAHVDDRFKRAVGEHIGAICVVTRWVTRDAASLEFAALIERERLGELQAAGDALKRACPDVPFLLSAPWPLEVFADADHQR
ncbi:MAG TPA: GvpL/GvpF family gas vesicle protein [Thermoanaerobaculia bacterium]|nr:GvpL/GvpF family gas vesicle protein [Thermoanaerobaculia bacterium]